MMSKGIGIYTRKCRESNTPIELCVRVSEDAFNNMAIYAVDRVKAIQKVGFTKSEQMLIGKTGYAYDGYWTVG